MTKHMRASVVLAAVAQRCRLHAPGGMTRAGRQRRGAADRSAAIRSTGGPSMKSLSRAVFWSLVIMVMAGCATTEVSERQRYEGAPLARPDRIIVHDFTANP